MSSAVFSSDGRTLATAGHDKTVRLWNVTDPANPMPLGAPLSTGSGKFQMWQSAEWNGMQAALRNFLIASIGLILAHLFGSEKVGLPWASWAASIADVRNSEFDPPT